MMIGIRMDGHVRGRRRHRECRRQTFRNELVLTVMSAAYASCRLSIYLVVIF